MSRHLRRLVLTFALLIVGAVLGHAAEHEGWFQGVFHCDSCVGCPESASACPTHSHDHADCECHGHGADGLPAPAPTVLPAFSGDLLGTPILLLAWSFEPAPELAPPLDPPMTSPPWVRTAGCAPLLV